MMSRLVIFTTILVVLSAVLMHQLHKRLFGLPVPEGFNPNSTFSFQVVGFTFQLARDLSSLGAFLGLVDNRHVCIRNFFGLATRLTSNHTFINQLEVNDTEIFGTKVRIYKPINTTRDDIEEEGSTDEEEDKDKLLPSVIYLHGGGWTVGSVDAYDTFCRRLAVTAQVVVVSVDYRQAPEYVYPTQLTDCYNVAVGLLNTGAKYGVDTKRVMIAGDSAGGNLAAAVTHNLAYVAEKHCSKQYLVGQILIYPGLQMLDVNLPSHQENENSVILSKLHVAEFISLYLTGNTDLVDSILAGNHSRHLENTTYMSYVRPRKTNEVEDSEKLSDEENNDEDFGKPEVEITETAADALVNVQGSPLMAKNFRGTPKTLLMTAQYDPLRDEGFLYAERLKGAGVDLVHKHYNSFHGFVTITSEPWPFGTQEGIQAMEDIVDFIQRMKTDEEFEKSTP